MVKCNICWVLFCDKTASSHANPNGAKITKIRQICVLPVVPRLTEAPCNAVPIDTSTRVSSIYRKFPLFYRKLNSGNGHRRRRVSVFEHYVALVCFPHYESFWKEWDWFTIIRNNELQCVPPKEFSNMVLLPLHITAAHRGKGKREELVR